MTVLAGLGDGPLSLKRIEAHWTTGHTGKDAFVFPRLGLIDGMVLVSANAMYVRRATLVKIT